MKHTYILNLFLELLVRPPRGHGAKPVGVLVHFLVKCRGRPQVAGTANHLSLFADDRESPGGVVIGKRRHLGPANRSAQAQIGTLRDPIAIEHHSPGPLREGEQKERNLRGAYVPFDAADEKCELGENADQKDPERENIPRRTAHTEDYGVASALRELLIGGVPEPLHKANCRKNVNHKCVIHSSNGRSPLLSRSLLMFPWFKQARRGPVCAQGRCRSASRFFVKGAGLEPNAKYLRGGIGDGPHLPRIQLTRDS
jgi:hypothetical protein